LCGGNGESCVELGIIYDNFASIFKVFGLRFGHLGTENVEGMRRITWEQRIEICVKSGGTELKVLRRDGSTHEDCEDNGKDMVRRSASIYQGGVLQMPAGTTFDYLGWSTRLIPPRN